MSSDKKHKLNLPQTGFPMRAHLPANEPAICEYWASAAFRQHLQRAHEGRGQNFLLHDGPPYANGDIHSGHAVNKILKDILVKSRWLDGKASIYVPGWDCHGLPIELKVEEQQGRSAGQSGRAEFRRACRKYALVQMERQRRSFIRLGVQGEWQHPYLTADRKYEADMLRALAQIVRRGHLLRGWKPVHWCTDCASALAEAEVEYQEHISRAVDGAFLSTDGALAAAMGLPAAARVAMAAWTTTPWTLPANQALCVHAEISYCAVRRGQGDDYLVLASELAEQVMARYGDAGWQQVSERKGAQLAGLEVQHPFQPRAVPVLLAHHVTLDVGTGIVHTAPAHGLDDWDIGRRHDLDCSQLVGPDGTYDQSVPQLGGLEIRAAEPKIIAMMRENGNLLAEKQWPHSYPHCWRHGTPLIFRATPQWFIGMHQAGLRDEAMQAADRVKYIPDSGRERFLSMLRERPDWCISRQRIWGVPLALFQHRQSGQAHPRTAEFLEQVAERIQQHGLDVWDELDAAELLGDEADSYEKCEDVLDVWFDSGASHYCVLSADERLQPPADIYLEGTDQHRGWFQSSLLTAVAMGRGAPYKSLVTHGFLVDQSGNKMSKSRGNGVLPDEIWDKWGADILRLWVASADYRGEMVLSEDILTAVAGIYRRIRNTLRFMLGNLYDFDESHLQQASEQLLPLDGWILARAGEVQVQLQREYEDCRLHNVCRLLHDFCAEDLGSFYLDILKDRLYTCKTDGPPRRSAQYALWHLSRALVCWMAPVLSFTAEEAWHHLGGQPQQRNSVFAESWHDLPQPSVPQAIDWTSVRTVREQVNLALEQARAAGTIGGALTAQVTIRDPQMVAVLRPLGAEAHFVLLVSSVVLSPGEGGELVQVERAQGQKCSRCWHITPTVQQGDESTELLCARCRLNLLSGEERFCA